MFGALPPAALGFRPLLKWPGGKAREWDRIAPFIPPDVATYVDPFMGGLAPFARTPFSDRALLNDRHERLVDLHRRVQAADPAFFSAAETLGRAWESLALASKRATAAFARRVEVERLQTAQGPRTKAEPDPDVAEAVAGAGLPEAAAACAASAADKARRVANLERRHGVRFDDAAVAEHGETAIRAGFYTFVRDREASADGAAATADFLFVRDFCYGSMFRHNAEGAFNIPYGGTSYNAKSFLARVRRLRSPATREALARATFSCGDFADLLTPLRGRLGPRDFVFADPPYDSEFRSYGPTSFSEDDHRRLAAALAELPCRWLLVIKETDFVRATYLAPDLLRAGAAELHAFGKSYGYNVRGRNDRATRHLIVGRTDARVSA